MPTTLLHTPGEMSAITRGWRDAHETSALVPTMGALHRGHLALVEAARKISQRVVVSIFVNPLQFGPREDFDQYPRDIEADLVLLNQQGLTDVAFVPDKSQMYPDGHSKTEVLVSSMASVLCGQARPTHFAGVTTVVAKLLNLVQPDFAVFGQKDAQQLAIVKRMVRDLNFPVEIVGVPTVREPSGLALSSRNRYLSAQQKSQAACIYQILSQTHQRFLQGERNSERLEEQAWTQLSEVGLHPEYVSIVDRDSLVPVAGEIRRPATLAVACPVGPARLIDNILLDTGS